MGSGTESKSVKVKSFFVCFGLRTGTIIIGVTCTILFFMSFISEAMWLHATQNYQNLEGGLGIVHMTLFFIMAALSLLLVVGAAAEKSVYLTPWITCSIVYVVVSIIVVVLYAISGALVWLASLLFDLLFVYFIIVVWSYRNVLSGNW